MWRVSRRWWVVGGSSGEGGEKCAIENPDGKGERV